MYLTVRWLDPAVTDPNTIESYSDWPYSPIPHVAEATLWMIFVVGLWIFNFFLFFTLGKKSRKNPVLMEQPPAETPETPVEGGLTPPVAPNEELKPPATDRPGGPSGPSGPMGPGVGTETKEEEEEIPPKPDVDDTSLGESEAGNPPDNEEGN
jgi:hypothetical protein